MRFDIDYSHIFFDKYPLTEDEKRENAHGILKNVLGGMFDKDEFAIERTYIKISDDNFGRIIQFLKCIDILKEEFYLIVTNKANAENEHQILLCEIEKLIGENYQYAYITSDYICKELGVKRKTAEEIFLKIHDISIGDFLRKVRADNALELVKQGFTAERAAILSGFGSGKTFQRAVKSIYDKTISELKFR